MSAGHFTSGGHFIVLTGIKDGKITVADCGSRQRTKQTWSLDLIVKNQIVVQVQEVRFG